MATIQSIQEGIHPQAGRPATGTGRPEAADRPAVPARETVPAASDAALDPKAAAEFARKVEETLSKAAPHPYEVAFRVDEASHGFVIEIRNTDGTVIRQYPPEEMLNLRRRLDEMSGMVIDEMT